MWAYSIALSHNSYCFGQKGDCFSAYGNPSYFTELQQSLLTSLVGYKLPVDSISMSDVAVDTFGNLNMRLAIFLVGLEFFNKTGVTSLGFVFSNQTYKPNKKFGPYIFIADSYPYADSSGRSSETSHNGVIVGYAYHQKKKAEKAKLKATTLRARDLQRIDGDVPLLKGARFFSFEELQRCTNNFSEDNNIGAGGFGKVL